MTRSISAVAGDIASAWHQQKGGVNYAAKPYLAAMFELDTIDDKFMFDSARTVLVYFLGNAKTFRGPRAKELKAELKQILGGRS